MSTPVNQSITYEQFIESIESGDRDYESCEKAIEAYQAAYAAEARVRTFVGIVCCVL